MLNDKLLKKIKYKYKLYRRLQKLEIKNLSFLLEQAFLKRHLNDFEIKFLRNRFYNEMEIEIIDSKLDYYEVITEEETTDELRKEETELFSMRNQLRKINFVDENSDALSQPKFVLLNPDFKIDYDRYKEDVAYKSHIDISEGFKKLVKIYHLQQIFEDDNGRYFKKNNYAKQLFARDYEIFLFSRLNKGLNIKEAVDDVVAHHLEYMPFADNKGRNR